MGIVSPLHFSMQQVGVEYLSTIAVSLILVVAAVEVNPSLDIFWRILTYLGMIDNRHHEYQCRVLLSTLKSNTEYPSNISHASRISRT